MNMVKSRIIFLPDKKVYTNKALPVPMSHCNISG